MLLLVLACTSFAPGPVRQGRPGAAVDDSGLVADDSGGPSDDTGTTDPPEPGEGCVATASRASCFATTLEDGLSPVLEPGIAFDALVPSWNALTPAGAWIEVEVQVRVGGEWTDWYRLGVWAAGDSEIDRHSVTGQSDAWGTVYTDTLVLRNRADAARVRVTLEGGATVSRVAVAVADTGAEDDDDGGLAWGTSLDPPDRSQMEFDEGEGWCSPTSTSMILGWHAEQSGDAAVDASVPLTADQVYDSVYGGTGNWPFNTAFAATRGLGAEVGWLGAVSQLEPWIAAGSPVAVSAAWGPGELDGAPVSSTSGHLLVVSGFTADGDVEVHDPAAASDEEVERTYDRQQFARAWMGGSGGVAYLVWSGDRPGGPPTGSSRR